MEKYTTSEILEKWIKAWTLSRETAAPVNFKSGFKVDVGDEKQKRRYVFSEINDDFIQLSKSINESWVFLKVCATQEEIKNVVPEKWVIQPQGYMMSCFQPMKIPKTDLHADYKLEFETYNATFVVRIVTHEGELACCGYVVLNDDLAVYDRIVTENNHRRKGLATILLKELENIASSKGFTQNFLVATEEGRFLYESLGWEVYSLYNTIVIPDSFLYS